MEENFMEMMPHQLIRDKLVDIIKEMAQQKDAIEDHPDFATFEEQIVQIEEYVTHSEWGLAYDIILALLENGNFSLSGKNALSFVWLGLCMSCKAKQDGSICV